MISAEFCAPQALSFAGLIGGPCSYNRSATFTLRIVAPTNDAALYTPSGASEPAANLTLTSACAFQHALVGLTINSARFNIDCTSLSDSLVTALQQNSPTPITHASPHNMLISSALGFPSLSGHANRQPL